MRQAETFRTVKHRLKFGICAIKLGDGIGVAADRTIDLFADDAAGKALADFCRAGIFIFAAAQRGQQPL